MKRTLLALTLALIPTLVLAQQVPDRDVLLTQDGTLYTIESVVNDGSAPSEVKFFLRLTTQRVGQAAQTVTVPDSLAAGIHMQPALAYDADSKTLFVFWVNFPNPTSSELLLSSLRNGAWQPAVAIANQPFHVESNLKIRTSHRVGDAPLVVNAVWWEDAGDSESARYGLFVIEKGVVSSIYLDDLSNYLYVDENGNPVLQGPAAYTVDPNFNREILRHPALIDNGTPDTIDVIFGDVRTNSFNRVTLKPIIQGRIHIPIGFHPGARVPAPFAFTQPWSSSIDTMVSVREGTILLYNSTATAVNYLMYSDGAWSTVKSVPLSDKLSADAAVTALTRMINQ